LNTAILVVAFALAAMVIVLAIIAIAARDSVNLARTEVNHIRARFDTYAATHPYTESEVRDLRQQSVNESRSTVSGIVPFFPEWPVELNPRDARFIGSPVDFVVFDGIEDGGEVIVEVVEVQTGTTRVDPKSPQARVRDAVNNGRVTWRELRLDLESAEPPELEEQMELEQPMSGKGDLEHVPESCSMELESDPTFGPLASHHDPAGFRRERSHPKTP